MAKNIHATALTIEQLKAVLSFTESIERVYLELPLLEDALQLIKEYPKMDFYAASPYVLRNEYESKFLKSVDCDLLKGILVRNLESFSILNESADIDSNFELVLDSGLYILNSKALDFFEANSKLPIREFYSSLELNEHEIASLATNKGKLLQSSLVYGRIPMMISANCVRKTLSQCAGRRGFMDIRDRYSKEFPVYCCCDYCYNAIYNSVPLSLHNYAAKLLNLGHLRLDFTTESFEQTVSIIKYFVSDNMCSELPPYKEYTTGHIKKGIE